MSLDNMKVFNDFMYTTVTEVLSQQVELFNAASRGALRLVTKANVGDYTQSAMYGLLPGLMRRRNAYASGTVASTPLFQRQINSVKVAGGTPPILFEPQQMSWIQRSPDEAAVVIGQQFAKGMMGDMVNTAIRCLRAGISGVADAVQNDQPNRPTFRGLNRASAKFGDRAQDIVCWVLNGDSIHAIYDNALANSEQLFTFGTVNVRGDSWGRVFIITDSPALSDTGTGGGTDNINAILGLTEGAAVIEDNGDLFTNLETNNGTENIQRTWQAEYTFNVGLKGYSWDTASGGKSPTDSALGTAANWDKQLESVKDTAGVLLLTA
jgi:hypothetical protein